jgi:hypothetical protein
MRILRGMRALALASLVLASAAGAVEVRYPAGTLRGFPDLGDEHGTKVADGRWSQWVEGDRLFARLDWSFLDGRQIEEQVSFRQGRELVQESWSFVERDAGHEIRRFGVDFNEGRAWGRKGSDHWSEKIDVKPGKTFVGLGFQFAAANLLPRLQAGEKIDLDAVAFMPKPRTAGVELSVAGAPDLVRAGKSLPAIDVIIHPKVPWPISAIVKARDIHLRYYRDAPPQLLRAELPMAEVGDPMMRIDVLAAGKPLRHPEARTGRQPGDRTKR